MGVFAQKKPLDHSVYDGWEAIQERKISNDGNWLAFTVNPQEGDGKLMVMKSDGGSPVEIARGNSVAFSQDSRFAIFKIDPTYQESREARIKKKKGDDVPKDSLGYLELATGNLKKIARVRSFKMPDNSNWLVYHMEKPLPDTTKKAMKPKADPKLDSARRVIDSLQALLNQLPEKVQRKYLKASLEDHAGFVFEADADEPNTTGGKPNEVGGDLIWLDLNSGKELVFKNIMDFSIDSIGGKSMALETGKIGKDSLAKVRLLMVDVAAGKVDTIAKDLNDIRLMRFDETGMQLAYLAESDSSEKALRKFYKLYYFNQGSQAPRMLADRASAGKTNGWQVSEMAAPKFSKSGNRLFFGVAPVYPMKDTSLPEIDRVSVDVWHYNDDYLQPQQLNNLNRELNRNYEVVYFLKENKMVQLADETLENVQIGLDGDNGTFLGTTNAGYRIESQWEGGSRIDIYGVDAKTGSRSLIKKGISGFASMSPAGNYVAWYDRKEKQYFTFAGKGIVNISAKLKFALWDEDNDVPADPGPYGQMGWHDRDEAVYVYDRYDIWKLDPAGLNAPVCITNGEGRKNKIQIRFQRLDAEEERSLSDKQQVLLMLFNEKDKTAGMRYYNLGDGFSLAGSRQTYPVAFSGRSFQKAKNADMLSFGTETFARSGDIKVVKGNDISGENNFLGKGLYQPNPQQENYNWMTAELIEWKTYNGKMTKGILYKPENFEAGKKYPMISYFYETSTDGLYRYIAPAPTPSRLNIPFFVSRGYLVLVPDIYYKTGQPGQDAFDHVVSGVRHVVKMGLADSTRLGLQGQSWGGYQIAQMITMTPLFRAAWAGAPVANMTSAYGGIRWGSGLNRQFQYEKTQSRIGATLWERQDLYIKNSPLFYFPNVTTPVVIMHNDEDGSVPWYQGIEMFTALRRLNKQVWLLNYNGEDHNLVARKNRKDISIREQQFFDWLLMDKQPAKWLKDGVPATMKGRDLGLE